MRMPSEGWALFFILAVILLLVILLINLLKKDRTEDEVPPLSYDYSSAPTPAPPAPAVKPAKRADEQSYYQFTGPSLRQCAFCGGENEPSATRCQICGKSL